MIGIQESKLFLLKELMLVSLRVKDILSEAYDQWIQRIDHFLVFIFFVSFFCILAFFHSSPVLFS